MDARYALEERLFTNLGQVNCCDSRLCELRLGQVEVIVSRMTVEERTQVSTRLEGKLRALDKVKRDLTVPTRPGGFNQARSMLIDREVFFGKVLALLRS